jgi:hypothetical protein
VHRMALYSTVVYDFWPHLPWQKPMYDILSSLRL